MQGISEGQATTAERKSHLRWVCSHASMETCRLSVLLTLGIDITMLLAAMPRGWQAERNRLSWGLGSWGWSRCCRLMHNGLRLGMNRRSMLYFVVMRGRDGRNSLVHSRWAHS
jgi:hypothetical protein